MKKLLLYIACSLLVSPAFSQGWVTKDAHVVIKDNANIVVHGATGNYTNKGVGLITTTNDGTLLVDGQWTNDGTTSAIGNNVGTVVLTGGNQSIAGSHSTSFNNLELAGGGIKSLMVETLVGGGYGGTKQGQLILNDRHLVLNSQLLIINNPATTAISRKTGMLLSETDPTVGYGKVQWNMRDVKAGNVYVFPFGTLDFLYIPLKVDVIGSGAQASDSAYISAATYPTDALAIPNNRPLPIGVPHLENRYKIENDLKSLDRYFIMASDGYTNKPNVTLGFTYVDREWDGLLGGTNTLIEKDMQAARYDPSLGAWDYSTKATTNVANNQTTTRNISKIAGAWVLHNNPNCPIPNFTFENACFNSPILFTDSSYIQIDSIDTSVWVYENNELYDQDKLFHNFSSDGLFDVTRKVRGQRGCWDSITKSVQIYPPPASSFRYIDTCLNETTQFASTSFSTIGMPLKHSWTMDGATYSTTKPNHRFGSEGLKLVQLITENTFGCIDTLNKTIEIESLPQVAFGFNNICERQEAFFFDSTTTKGSIDEWKWTVRNKIVSYLPDHNQVFNVAGSYPIQLATKNSAGCVDSLERMITIWPKAKAKFDNFPKDIYITDPFVNFVQSGSDANSWRWDFGDFSPEEYGPEALHQYLDTGIFRARLIADNNFKCADTFYRTVIIKPNLRIFIPNAFSPGPDNDVNKTFGPAGMLYGIKNMEMTIYTRWGEQIYYSDHIDKPWDGTYMGELVQEGTYLYLIKIKDVYNDVFRYSGTLSVIR